MPCLKGEYAKGKATTRKTKLGARGQGDKEARGDAYGERGALSVRSPCCFLCSHALVASGFRVRRGGGGRGGRVAMWPSDQAGTDRWGRRANSKRGKEQGLVESEDIGRVESVGKKRENGWGAKVFGKRRSGRDDMGKGD